MLIPTDATYVVLDSNYKWVKWYDCNNRQVGSIYGTRVISIVSLLQKDSNWQERSYGVFERVVK